ncbi:MAG TPA: hypothetical protein VJ036_08095, partial [bacterium]|nr:hypothetical protein [bacterium]
MTSYRIKIDPAPDIMAAVRQGRLHDPIEGFDSRRTIIKNGLVVDPANDIEAVMDIAIIGDTITQLEKSITP